MQGMKKRFYVHCPERVSVRLSPDQRQKLENYSREAGISMSWMIATLIDSYVPENKEVA